MATKIALEAIVYTLLYTAFMLLLFKKQAHLELTLQGDALQTVLIKAEALACIQFVIFALVANQ